MSTSPKSTSLADEHRRKRVRKGTKSCWECKRRKIRCQLSSEDVSVCAGCLTRGTTCLSQEFPEEHDGHSSGNHVGERLGRVESLLEKMLTKMEAYEEEERAEKSLHTPESMGGADVYVSASSTTEHAPILSLFDNAVLGRRATSSYFSPDTLPSPSASGTKTPSCRPSKLDRLRQTLSDLLPSQKDTNLICEESSCWMLIHAFSLNRHDTFEDSIDVNVSAASNLFDVAMKKSLHPEEVDVPATLDLIEITKAHPVTIAQTLLYICICLQQLPPTFDTSRLHLPSSIDIRLDRIISTVQTLVSSDDELVSTIDGLKCLNLQGIFHVNCGNPRRAWLSFRRALNIAQLMGLHKSNTTIPGGRDIWLNIVRGDRYLGLLLGLPVGCPDEEDDHEMTPDPNKPNLDFDRSLSQISGAIIERNQNNKTETYTSTQGLDEKLEKLAKRMAPEWWIIPKEIPYDKSLKSAYAFEALMTQIWYFQLVAILHLPFMLRNERRFEYSRFSCLRASREMMSRYLALRMTDMKTFCCKVVDFGALTATVTLLLGLLEPPQAGESREIQDEKESDRALVRTVLASMEDLSKSSGDVIARQCVDVIKALLSAESPEESNGGNLRLTIPYFGTISIARQQNTPPNNPIYPKPQMPPTPASLQSGTQVGAPAWQAPQNLSYQPISAPGPVVSFTSSHFPAVMPEQQVESWGLPPQADTFFFDGMLETDIDGNWVF